MPIRWKVIRKVDRTSCIVYSNKKYCLVYKKGTTVVAKKGTLDSMVFKRRRDAESFRGNAPNQVIIRVNGVGKGKCPKEISSILFNCAELDRFYKGDLTARRKGTPTGTICYKSVEVLE